MRKKLLVVSFFCPTLLFFFITSNIFATDLNFVPSINARGTYNSNVFFTFEDEEDDYYVTIRPAATLLYNTQLVRVKSLGAIDIDRYAIDSDLDDEKYLFKFDLDYQFLPRWTASGLFSFIQDDTFDTELTETGRVTQREQRRRYDAGGKLGYQMSELSDIELEVVYTKKQYDGTGIDTDRVAVIADYNRKLKNQRDVISFIPFYNYRENDKADLNVIGAALGWEHPFSETLVMNARAGLHYWNQDLKDDDKSNTGWGPVADINLEKSGEIFTALLGYRRDIRATASGQFVSVDRIYTRLDRRITERLRGEFKGALYFSRTVEGSNDRRRFFDLRPSLTYRITENFDTSLTYNYRDEYDNDINDKRFQHRVWLWFNFNFPGNWSW